MMRGRGGPRGELRGIILMLKMGEVFGRGIVGKE